MPKQAVKKVNSGIFPGTPVFGWMIIGLAIGGLVVFIRYIMISYALPADVYVIEPASIIPGMQ